MYQRTSRSLSCDGRSRGKNGKRTYFCSNYDQARLYLNLLLYSKDDNGTLRDGDLYLKTEEDRSLSLRETVLPCRYQADHVTRTSTSNASTRTSKTVSHKHATTMTTHAPAGAPSPPLDDTPAKGYGSWVPHDLPYNAEFEDDLIDIILNPDHDASRGVRVIPEDEDEVPVDNHSVRFQDIDLTTLPTCNEADLPIPLSDSRRIYAHPIPGIKLTHPYGWVEGGPSLDPQLDTFADDFLLNRPDVTTVEQLRAAVNAEVTTNIARLRERLLERQKAKNRNEQILKELKTKTDQHELEKKIHERQAEETRRKKEAREARERKRAEKEGTG